MDENGSRILGGIPAHALTLRLARSTIKMRHTESWRVDKSTNLMQHHLFMVILLEYLEAAFLRWRDSSPALEPGDALSLHIMRVAAQVAGDPLDDGVLEAALAAAPYNPEYFRRAFRDKIGCTPQKFQGYKNTEKAMNILAVSRSVKETAALDGYDDAYFFSRMFKRYMGTSPSHYQLKVRQGGGWQYAG